MDLKKTWQRLRVSRNNSWASATKLLPNASKSSSILERNEQDASLNYSNLQEKKEEIRVLEILPGEDHEEVRCRLKHHSCLKSFPRYTALSYCWGNLTDLVPITVNGCPHQVTRNLEAALRALRKSGRNSIWVDALCINQKDKVEQGHQILRMKDIYKNGIETIAWLGNDHGGHAELGFTRLELLARKTPRAEFEESIAELLRGRTGWSKTLAAWPAVQALLDFPYWQRTWIIQELALSPRVMFLWGQHETSLNTLNDAVAVLRENKPKSNCFERGYKDIVYLLHILERTKAIAGKKGMGMDMETILSFSRRSLATKPEDKMFGVVGLCFDGSILLPNPSYLDPLDTILRNMTILRIKLRDGDKRSRARPMDLICIDNPTTQKRRDLPSWVTDWPKMWIGAPGDPWASSDSRGLRAGYQACGKSKAEANFLENDMILSVRGYVFDIVRSTSAVMLIDNEKHQNYVSPAMLDQDSSTTFSRNDNIYGNEDNLYEAIWRTLFADRALESKEKAPVFYRDHLNTLWYEDGKQYESRRNRRAYQNVSTVRTFEIYGRTIEAWTQYKPTSEPTSKLAVPKTKAEQGDFIRALKFRDMDHRRLITTGKGYVGLAHAQSVIGDKICLLMGCTMPMILRPYEGGYRLVGETYVHGIMDGEFWYKQSKGAMETFNIK